MQEKNQADKIASIAFVTGFAICVASFAIWAVTGRPQPAMRILVTAFWLVFAVLSGNAFYTGRFTWKGGPTYTREEAPWMFYLSSIFFAVGSMSIATFLLWVAYFDK